jgi:hypothetical protein
MRSSLLWSLAVPVLFAACSGEGAVYPPRPPATPGEAIADPAPSRVVMHTTVTAQGMKNALDEAVPKTGDGTFKLLGKDRKYTWKRGPVAVKFDRNRVVLDLHVDANAEMPVSSIDAPLDFHIAAEPVISSEYKARLQSIDLKVSSEGKLVKAADKIGDVLTVIQKEVEKVLQDFAYDLKPVLGESFQRVAKPIDLPLGDAKGCATLKILNVEAGPTVMADGFEKDLAVVVAPSVTIPCAENGLQQTLPPLSNVASIPTGPFTVQIPIAARYDELAKAMSLAFTDGKLFFSKDMPEVYMDQPEIYAAKDQIVLKVHLGGKAAVNLDADIFLTGHPTVVDNELRVPDLEPTVETSNWLVKFAAAIKNDTIREQARNALKLDIADRLKSVRSKLSTDLAFGNGMGCVKANTDKIEIGGVHVHQNYLRVYVNVTARTNVYLPCPG